MSTRVHLHRPAGPAAAPRPSAVFAISDISGPRRPVSFLYILVMILMFMGALIITGHKMAFFFVMVMVIAGCLIYSLTVFHEALYIFAFAIPLEQAFYAFAGGRYNTLSYLAFVLAFIWIFRFGRTMETARISTNEKFVLFWVLWAGLSLIWTHNFVDGSKTFVTCIGGFAVLFIFSRGLKNLRYIGTCVWFYLIGTVLLTLYLLPYYKSGSAYVRVSGRFIPSAIGLGYGIAPHEVSRTYAMGMICALMLWQYENTRLKRNIAMGLAIFLGLLVPLCLSRSTVISLSMGLLAWMMFKGGKARLAAQVKRFITFLLLITSVVALVSYINQEAFMTRVAMSQDEYEHGNMAQLTTGRTKIWGTALQLIIENPILGLGLGSFPLVYSIRTGDITRAVHNQYLNSLVELGIIGLALFLFWIIGFGWNAWKLKTMRQLTIAWWITIALILVGHDIFRGKDFWLILAFITVMARLEAVMARRTVADTLPARSARPRPCLPSQAQRKELSRMPGPSSATDK